MNLAFSTKWPNGLPTYFVEKIWRGLESYQDYMPFGVQQEREKYQAAFIEKGLGTGFHKRSVGIKITTIREDSNDRWKAGNKIHFVINNRTKNRFQFAPVIFCRGVQRFEIKHNNGNVKIFIDGKLYTESRCEEGLPFFTTRLHDLARWDGFDSTGAFLKWFNKDFSGKIIHWTDLLYNQD